MTTVTKASIEAKIRNVYYINAGAAVQASDQGYNERDLEELNLVTICIIILENGFKVEGTSACVDPSRYNEAIGQEEAYKNAFDKIWEKEGYLLKQQLHEANQK
ncbi:Gp49 family protein [Klebsiella variicola]|uniref:Gp49 family protein n=1 Tax=Klebsiella variicola TaxID=244366 RepID=UPI00339C37CB